MKHIRLIYLLLLLLLVLSSASAQDTTISLAFKENRGYRPRSIFYLPDPSYKIRQQFALIKEANTGDPIAQHELGLRYLLGDGFAADTVEGAKWIRRAADKGLASASFNYAILLINGWGAEWNPFEAYKYFLSAAQNGMPAAEHVVGLLHLENLIVKKDLSVAYGWFKNAANAGYEPAKISLADFTKRIKDENLEVDTTSATKPQEEKQTEKKESVVGSSSGLVFIDFDAIRDTSRPVENQDLLNDLFFTGNDSLITVLKLSPSKKDSISIEQLSFDAIKNFNQSGSPEVYTMLGWLFQNGINTKKDFVKAAEYYIRAVRVDSYRAPFLLWNLVQTKYFIALLKNEVDKGNPSAMYVFAGLFITGLDTRITAKDAIDLLIKASGKNHIPSMVELGLAYYTGKYVPVEKNKAITIWNNAVKLGSSEAKIRLAASEIFDNDYSKVSPNIISLLRAGDMNGSVMAQVALAYCYKNGFGVKKNIAEAVKYNRYAAQRGSRFALDELKSIYNLKRPNEAIFAID
ncbi:MAG: sel1 repeat family protein [Ignavibacteriaceae bacterium]|nr:sel1 repeat family protein [Ignavibacteriaceae bacterium]